MRLHMVACKALQREAYLCAAKSKNIVDVTILPQGLHDEPDKLRTEAQAAIARTQDVGELPYDAIILGYGLCSNGTAGLTAPLPMIIPRAHDCITLLLGCKQHYQDYFDSHKGVYWYSAGWIESTQQPGKARYDRLRQHYIEKYGDDNADYLMEMEQGWLKEYNWATYINWDFAETEAYRQYTKECADFLNWNFDELPGNPSLMQTLMDGPWDDQQFLTVPPGHAIAADLTNPGIMRAQPLPPTDQPPGVPSPDQNA